MADATIKTGKNLHESSSSSSSSSKYPHTKKGDFGRLSVKEKNIEEALLENRKTLEDRIFTQYRELYIYLRREDGRSEVFLGQTHVTSVVTSHLTEPHRDRQNEGTLTVFFVNSEGGGHSVELGELEHSLRSSKAVDTESLCVVRGKFVWALRVNICVHQNGGNLVDAANIAALAALKAFRLPKCTLGGEHRQEVIVNPLEVIPLMIHHLPIAVTFAFLTRECLAIDPNDQEEAVMMGKMTITIDANDGIHGIQKAGREGVRESVLMEGLLIASKNAAIITKLINESLEEYYNNERGQPKFYWHTSSTGIDAARGIVCEIEEVPSESQETVDSGIASSEHKGFELQSGPPPSEFFTKKTSSVAGNGEPDDPLVHVDVDEQFIRVGSITNERALVYTLISVCLLALGVESRWYNRYLLWECLIFLVVAAQLLEYGQILEDDGERFFVRFLAYSCMTVVGFLFLVYATHILEYLNHILQ